MAKPSSWNEDVVKGVEITSTIRQGAVTATTTASAIVTASTNINWVIIQSDDDNGAALYVGSSTVANSGANRGIRLGAGEAIQFIVDDLNKIFVISASGSQTVLYLAGSP